MTPTPPSPVPAGPLVAVKERRAAVITALSHAFSRDELDVDELDRRLEQAQRAATVAELDALVADLEAPASTAALALSAPAAAMALSIREPRQRIFSIMGGVQRTGRWVVPRRLTISCLMGGVLLDFREADFGVGVTDLVITCLMGGVQIIVPPSIHVEVGGSAILGGFEQGHPGSDALAIEPVATLRIGGLALLGGVQVETRRVGETSRQARKRIKSERKLLLDTASPVRASLPEAVALPERKPKH
jgi:Domain of unknown function (DUF1707)/Cell wall-active antibiotics response 4TMS YvqF